MEREPIASSIDEYIARYPAPVQAILQEIRARVKAIAPDAQEAIKYAIPTFVLNGKNLFHFAAYKNHIGLYPTPTGMDEFKEALSPYKTAKGSAQIPLDQPMPYDLIERIVRFRLGQVQAAKKAKKNQ